MENGGREGGCYMKKIGKTGLCLLLCAAFLTGCGQAEGPDTITDTTLSVGRKGTVTSYLVGGFARDYYDISELETMVKEETAAYNASSGGEEDAIEVASVELLESDPSRVMIHLEYDSVESYCGYNDTKLFYGTVEEAAAAGYPLSEPMVSVKDGSEAAEDFLRLALKQHVIVTDEPILFYCPYSVAYLSEGAVLNEDGSVDMSGCQGTGIILMKK